MDVVMVGNGVVVVLVRCFLSICFSLIDLGFVVCYLISVGLDCDFCPLSFWFLSMFFGFFFFFGKISMLFGLISIGSGFWFLCNCVLQIFCALVLFVLQIRNHPTAPTRSSNDSSHRVRPNVRVVVGLFFVHPIWSGQVQVKPKPDPTRPVDKTM